MVYTVTSDKKGKDEMSKKKKVYGRVKTVLKSIVKRKVSKVPPRILLNVKVSEEEREAIESKAKQFTRGNISAWLRYSGVKCQPRKKDVTKAA